MIHIINMPRINATATNHSLVLSVFNTGSGDIGYRYSRPEIVQNDADDRLKITLDNQTNYPIHLHNFCCSSGDAITLNTPSINPADPYKDFDEGTKELLFDLNNLSPRELINIGIIIRIDHPTGTKYELCDPQVGNDPP